LGIRAALSRGVVQAPARRGGSGRLNNAPPLSQRRKLRAMKTAKELVGEMGLAVQPPQGIAIVVTEEPGALPNWVAAAGIMEAALTKKFSKRVVELRKTDPLIDWSEVDKRQDRRVVKFLSEARD
jgi:hypothetical protein